MLDHTCPQCAYERWTIDCNFARVRILQGKYSAAEHLLTEALALSQSVQREPPAEIAEVQQQLAEARRKQRRIGRPTRPLTPAGAYFVRTDSTSGSTVRVRPSSVSSG